MTFLIFQNKSKFQTYVVASGLMYGMGENIFHFLFKVRSDFLCSNNSNMLRLFSFWRSHQFFLI